MCWNASVSLNTFIFGLVCASIAVIFGNYDKAFLLIPLSLSLIQLLEYFAWNNINNKKIINILSYIGLFIIFIQVFLLNYLFTNGKIRIILLTIMFSLLLLFLIIEFKNVKFTMEKGKNDHLIWYWLDVPIIWIFITIMFYLIPLYFSKYIYGFYFVLISIIISLYFYFKYKTWGTMWCYMSNLIWVYILLNTLIYKIKYV
jgi:hypothetical protein